MIKLQMLVMFTDKVSSLDFEKHEGECVLLVKLDKCIPLKPDCFSQSLEITFVKGLPFRALKQPFTIGCMLRNNFHKRVAFLRL